MNQEILLILRELRSDVKLVELDSTSIHKLCGYITKNDMCHDIPCDGCPLIARIDYIDKTLEELNE